MAPQSVSLASPSSNQPSNWPELDRRDSSLDNSDSRTVVGIYNIHAVWMEAIVMHVAGKTGEGACNKVCQ